MKPVQESLRREPLSGTNSPLFRVESSSTVASSETTTTIPGSASLCHLIPTNADKKSSLHASSKVNSVINQVVTSCCPVDEKQDSQCGWGFIQPSFLQRFRSPQWALFCLCWAGALQGLIVNGFINVVITTIEKRYELRSTETGLIAGSYDIASFLCLIPISYFGGSRSKPLFIGTGLIVIAFGSLVFSLPHFLAGPYSFSQELDHHCHSGFQRPNSTSLCSTGESHLSSYKYVFFLGQFLHGAGAVPLYTLGCTFLDENVPTKMSSVYLGIFYTMAIVGPAIGYVLGGQLLKIYVDIGVDAYELGLSPSSTVWVGAWWIGFVVAAVIGLLVAIPIVGFPKTLPSTEKVKASKVSEMHQKLQDSEASRMDFGVSLSDLPKSFKLLMANPPFIFLSLAGASEGMLVAGLATFLPKLIESQFSYQASFAAFIVGMVTIPGAGGGNFLGGYLVKKFNLKCGDIIRLCIAFCVACFALSFIFILHCPDANFAGLNAPLHNKTNQSRFITECNSHCTCSTTEYDPICGADNTIYYSPCYAGCRNVYHHDEKKVFGSCSCIGGKGRNMTVGDDVVIIQATRQKCNNNCEHGPLFLAIIFLCMFFTFLVSMPSLSATLRCVPESQKSFGLGVQWIAVRVLGTIPAPVLFGWLIDQSCILWQEGCHAEGACLFYNNQKMSTNLLVIICSVKFLSCVFFFLSWYLYKPPSAKDVIEDHSKPMTEIPSLPLESTFTPSIKSLGSDSVTNYVARACHGSPVSHSTETDSTNL